MTYMAVCVRRVLEVVPEWNEEAGDEAGQREQHRQHSEVGERDPDEGPVPVQAAVRTLEHPGQTPDQTGLISTAHLTTSACSWLA